MAKGFLLIYIFASISSLIALAALKVKSCHFTVNIAEGIMVSFHLIVSQDKSLTFHY